MKTRRTRAVELEARIVRRILKALASAFRYIANMPGDAGKYREHRQRAHWGLPKPTPQCTSCRRPLDLKVRSVSSDGIEGWTTLGQCSRCAANRLVRYHMRKVGNRS